MIYAKYIDIHYIIYNIYVSNIYVIKCNAVPLVFIILGAESVMCRTNWHCLLHSLGELVIQA